MNTNKNIIYIGWVITALYAMVSTTISPLLTEIASSFSINMAQSGILFTANFIGYVSFILIGGLFADKYGIKKLLNIVLVGYSISIILFSFSPNFYTMCIIITFIGGFGGTIVSNTNALVNLLMKGNSALYLTLNQVFYGIGAFIGPVIASIVLSRGLKWNFCYYYLGVSAVVITAIFLLIRAPYTRSESVSLGAARGILSDKRFLKICFCMFLYSGCEVSAWGWLSTFLKRNMNFSITKSGTAVGVFWIFFALGSLLCATLAKKYSPLKLIIIMSGTASIITLLSGIVNNEILIWVIISSMGFTYSGLWPLIAAHGGSEYKNLSGTVFAILGSSSGVGATIIPYLIGFVGQDVGIKVALASPAMLLMIISLIFIRIKSKVDKNRNSVVSTVEL